MAYIIRLPGLGMQTDRATLVEWHVSPGDEVNRGDVIAEIETEKATSEIEAREDGVLRRVHLEEGAEAEPGDPLGIVAAPDEDVSDLEAKVDAEAVEEPAAETTTGRPSGGGAGRSGAADADVKATPRAKKRAEELGVDLAAVDGTGPGGAVTGDDVEAAVESGEEEVTATPRARKRAEEHGVPLAAVEGTGPDGAITADDVETHLDGGSGSGGPAPMTLREERELSGMRRTIADRLGQSHREAVHVTEHREADAESLLAAAEAASGTLDADVGLLDVLLVALSATLDEHPEFNATFEAGSHRLYEEHNVGVAVDLDGGLITPVLPAVEGKSLAEVAGERERLTERALAGDFTDDDLRNGTFTVSNLGAFGVESFTPIIDPPQVAILGVGTVLERVVPAAGADEFRAQRRLPLDLSFDHRVVDGADAARFLDTLVGHLEAPWPLLPASVESPPTRESVELPGRSVRAESENGHPGTVSAGSFEWPYDVRHDVGGDGTAPTPVDLFLGALSSCLSASIGYQARKRDVELSNVGVSADASPDHGSVESLSVAVELDAPSSVDDSTLERIVELGERGCHVAALLDGDVPLDLSWERAPG